MIERDAPDEDDITQDGSVPGDPDLITEEAEPHATKDPDEAAAGASDQADVDLDELSEAEKDRELRHY